jgi:hypothetical protein
MLSTARVISPHFHTFFTSAFKPLLNDGFDGHAMAASLVATRF